MNLPAIRLAALSVAAGLLMAISFPLGPPLPTGDWDGWWPAAWICLAPLMIAASLAPGRLAALGCGLASGITAFGLILSWMYPFLTRWAGFSALEAIAVFGLLILYVAIYFAAFALCVHLWSRRWGGRTAYLLAPAAWVSLELVRGVVLTGFPWCLLGHSQQPLPAAIQIADVAGVYGVSSMLASGGALAAILIAPLTGDAASAARGRAPFVLLAVILIGLGYGAIRLETLPSAAPTIRVALIQANVAQADKWDPGERLRIEQDHFSMTREAARQGASFIIWSESSVPISITQDPAYALRLRELAGETRADLLVGTVAYEEREGRIAPFNSAVLVRPDSGPAGRYDKLHLVPFGEYVPLKTLLFFVSPLVQEASDFHPGDDVRLLSGSGFSFGTLICYEAIFPDLTRRYVKAGAEAILNITNDAWYGETAMPRQHLSQAALRAVESRRYLLRCANTGISAFVEPSGRIAKRSRLGEKISLEAEISAAFGTTIYAAAGDAFAICCGILTLVALTFARREASSGERSGR